MTGLAGRAGWGLALLALAPRAARLDPGWRAQTPQAEPTVAVIRALGARHVVQAVAETLAARTRWEGRVAAASAAVDALHVASLPALALALPRHRRLFAIDAPGELMILATSLRSVSSRPTATPRSERPQP